MSKEKKNATTGTADKHLYAAGGVIGVLFCLGIALAGIPCSHEAPTETVTVTMPSCEVKGMNHIICTKCDGIVEEVIVPETGHSFGDYYFSIEPNTDGFGTETRVCSVCEHIENREFVCPHEDQVLELMYEPSCSKVGINKATCPLCSNVQYLPIDKIPHAETKSVIHQEPTCSVEGIEHLICLECEEIAEEKPIELLECNWADWEIDVYATPFEEGERHHKCQDCGREASEKYTIELAKNHIYIPEANILCKFAVSTFTQGAVDSNDVVYTKRAYGVVDDTNPFVLGHWFGSLTTMWHTPVGAYVYINIDGRIDTYQVINSEYAVEMYECYHIGQETGVNVFDAYGSAMNSQYAVYGRNHQGKDLDPEKNDGRTLHMYTCHNRKDRPGWDPKHGGRGRWIILGNLIHSVDIETGEILFEEEPADLTSLKPVEVPENTEKQPS